MGHLNQLNSYDSNLQYADDLVSFPYEYSIPFAVFESYTDGNCEVKDYILTVSDDLSPSYKEYEMTTDNYPTSGEREYVFTANEMNHLDGGTNPCQLSIQLVAETDDGRSAGDVLWLLVVNGSHQFENAGFTLATSKKPYYVIRVPPGDGSYSTIEAGTSSCESTTFEYRNEGGALNEMTMQLGFTKAFTIGIPPVLR